MNRIRIVVVRVEGSSSAVLDSIDDIEQYDLNHPMGRGSLVDEIRGIIEAARDDGRLDP